MKLYCIFGFHKWAGCTCTRCGKIRSGSAHEAAMRLSANEAAKKRDLDKVLALLKDNPDLVQQLAEQLERAKQTEHGKGLASFDSSSKTKLQPSQPRDAGMISSRD